MMRRSREAHIIGESVLERDGAIDEVYGSLGNISSGTFLSPGSLSRDKLEGGTPNIMCNLRCQMEFRIFHG